MTKIQIASNLIQSGIPMMTPNYPHDCNQCVFLGRSFHDGTCDIWFCPRDSMLIYRESYEGAAYRSMRLEMAVALAKDSGAGSVWSQAVSRYDDWEDGLQVEWNQKELPKTYRVQSKIGADSYSGREVEQYARALEIQKYLHTMGIPAKVQTPIGWDEDQVLVWQNVG